MNIRTVTAAAAIALGLTLTGCGASDTAAKKEPAVKATEAGADTAVDCQDQNLSQAEWTEHCADDAGAEEAPDTDLKVGQTYTYDDGVKVSIDSIKTVTEFGEYDIRPDATQRGFFVNVTFDNGSKKPLALDEFALTVEGATNGGMTEMLLVEEGYKEIAGRVAPGVKAQKNEPLVLDKKYGSQVVVTVNRMSEDTDFFEEPPTFTGPIR